MPYLIQCSKCGRDIVFKNLVVNTMVSCGNCFNATFVSEYVEQISKVEAKIREYGTKISKCPECSEEIKPNVKYCKDCGTKVSKIIELKIIYCPECHDEYEDGYTYCEKDGTKLSTKIKSVDIFDEFETINTKPIPQKDSIKSVDIETPKKMEDDEIIKTPETQAGNNELKKWIGIIVGLLVALFGVYVKNEYDSSLGFVVIVALGLLIMRLGRPNKKLPFD
jgi:hypothetical protein